MSAKAVNVVDLLVGQNIRASRLQMGMGLEGLGQQVGLSVQQIEKCETGKDRVSAPLLHSISRALDVDMGLFFRGIDTSEGTDRPNGLSTMPGDGPHDPNSILTLIKSFRKLSVQQQNALLALVVTISDTNERLARTGLGDMSKEAVTIVETLE